MNINAFSDVVGVCSPGVSSLHSGHATMPRSERHSEVNDLIRLPFQDEQIDFKFTGVLRFEPQFFETRVKRTKAHPNLGENAISWVQGANT